MAQGGLRRRTGSAGLPGRPAGRAGASPGVASAALWAGGTSPGSPCAIVGY
jgi:hypothetical protein